MYGPFFTLFAIALSRRSGSREWGVGSHRGRESPFPTPNSPLLGCLAALPAADDHPLRRLLLVARLDAFLVAPFVDDVAAAARAPAVRVVDRVHHLAAHLRPLAQ